MATTKWVLDPTHSELTFKIRHLMISNVSGSFNQFDVQVETEGEDFTTAKIQVKVDMNSISTRNAQRDEHLKASDFFETATYPELVFEATEVEKIDNEEFSLKGNLTMKGITKPIQLKVEYNGTTKDPWGGERAGFQVTGSVKRSDWGVTFNSVLETGGVALGEDVKLNGEIELVKQAVAVA
jgi:polyisoprenoid-binding protein YceI